MSNDTGLPASTVQDFPAEDHLADRAFGGRAATGAPPGRFGRLAMCAAAASALALGVVGTVAYGIWFNHDQRAYAEAMAGARQALGMTALGTSLTRGVSANAAVPTATVASAKNLPIAAASPALVGTSAGVPTSPAVAGTNTGVPKSLAVAGTNAGVPTSLAVARPNAGMPTASLAADPEAGSEQASWVGEVKRSTAANSAPTPPQANPPAATLAATQPAPATPVQPVRRASLPGDTTKSSSTGTRPGKEARLASQERHPESANSHHKDSLFARVGSFFRRVTYRQHGNGSQQDIYSHP